MQLAGLAHAAYGTHGLGHALLAPTDRARLRHLIGTTAERLVYLYGACHRGRSWPRLAETAQIWNRLTDQAEPVPAELLQPLLDLSILNELDVMEHNPALADRYGDYYRCLFASWAGVCSSNLTTAARRVLDLQPASPPSGARGAG